MQLLKKAVTLLILITCFNAGQAQQTATLLVITNKKARIIFDGEEKGITEPNIPFKVATTEGEHYTQVQYEENGSIMDKAEVITLEAGKQKIVRLLFEDMVAAPMSPIAVGELNFSIPGSVTVGIWIHNNPDMAYPYPAHFFAFEKGDEIILNATMTNKNGTNLIEVATYPNNVIKYTNNNFTELKDLKILVEERSIYRFTFATNHAFDRNCILRINRKPASPQATDFNTNVSKQKIFKPVTIVEPTALRVNSESNADFLGGKSRVLVSVTIPPNTVEWFYRFSASRNPEDIEKVRKNFQLFGELTKLFLTVSGAGAVSTKIVDIGVEHLTAPPGANYCDVYLLDYNNISAFESKVAYKYILQGTRENLMAGNVKMDCCNEGQYYLGVHNPDYDDGINVSIEVVAITAIEDFVMEVK
jgi:hypothetical protein